MDFETLKQVESVLSIATSIPRILDIYHRNDLFLTLQDIYSNFISLDQSIQLFHTFTDTNAKEFIIDNLCFWISSKWDEIIADEEIFNRIRTFLFVECSPNLQNYPKTTQNLIGKAQSYFVIFSYPEIWPNFFKESFFDTQYLYQALNFIYNLCNIIFNCHFFRRELFLQFINNININDITSMLFNLISVGITNNFPYAFSCLGYFSILFNSEWLSSNVFIDALMNSLLNTNVQANVLECAKLLMMSNLPLEMKQKLYVEVFQVYTILPQLKLNDSIIQASSLIYQIVIINQSDQEQLNAIVEHLAIPFLQSIDENVVFNIVSALHSALHRDETTFLNPIMSTILNCLNQINHSKSYITPPKHVCAIMNLLEACFTINTTESATIFDEFLANNFSNALEDYSTDITVLQVVTIYRTVTLKLRTVNIYPKYNDLLISYNALANPETWQGELNEAQHSLLYSYFSASLAIPDFTTTKIITGLFVSCITILLTIIESRSDSFFATARLLLSFTTKYKNLIVAEDDEHKLLLTLLRTLDPILCRIAVHLIESKEIMIANQSDLISLCIPQIEDLFAIEDDAVRTRGILSIIYFLVSRNNPIDRPDISAQIGEFLMRCIDSSDKNPKVVGTILGYLPKIGDVGFEIYQTLSETQLDFTSLKGCSIAMMQFYDACLKDVDNIFKMKPIVLSNEWINENFGHLTNCLITEIFPQFENNFHLIFDQEEVKESLSKYIDCGTKFVRLVQPDVAQAFIEFLQNITMKYDSISSVFSSICSFLQSTINHPIEGFDPVTILVPVHSFLFSPGLGFNLLPMTYKSMMAQFYKSNPEALQQTIMSILEPYNIEHYFAESYVNCFRSPEDYKRLPITIEYLLQIRSRLFII